MKTERRIIVSTDNKCLQHDGPCVAVVVRDESRESKKNILFHQLIPSSDEFDSSSAALDSLVESARGIFKGDTFIRLMLGMEYDHLLQKDIEE